MSQDIFGIHHVTAITSDPQRNLDFYTGVLGLRLVKLTVNFDDPRSYHLYYGDELGHPGTILTFFAWPGVPKGRQGTGQVTVTSFSILQASLDIGCTGARSSRAGLFVPGLPHPLDSFVQRDEVLSRSRGVP